MARRVSKLMDMSAYISRHLHVPGSDDGMSGHVLSAQKLCCAEVVHSPVVARSAYIELEVAVGKVFQVIELRAAYGVKSLSRRIFAELIVTTRKEQEQEFYNTLACCTSLHSTIEYFR
jgi:hypothetical protein